MPRKRRQRKDQQVAIQDPSDFGYFNGPVQAQWLPDGRFMALLEPLVFVQHSDPEHPWTALNGTLTDGASIPKPFWSVVGGPFEGKYRLAAVNHDFACCIKDRPWRSVHRMFYDGMRASGEVEWLAKLMYFAVYFFGPRWPSTEEQSRKSFSEADIARIARLLQRQPSMSLDEIESLNKTALRKKVPKKPKTVRGASMLRDSTPLVPVKRDAPCVLVLPE